jgi:hypothetical protein
MAQLGELSLSHHSIAGAVDMSMPMVSPCGTVKLTWEDEAAAGTAPKPVQINSGALSLSHRAK